jgi:hypothetical protein
MRNEQEPTVVIEKRPGDDVTISSHPAFVQIAASRVQGRVNLYDSDFSHNHHIVLRIDASKLYRSLNNDRHYPDHNSMVELAMTESQWATFVSTLNMGSGVPATLQRFNGQTIPGLPSPKSRAEQFGNDIKEDLADAISQLDALDASIEEAGLSKTKASALKDKVRAARASITSSIPWVVQQFDEHAETTTQKAKQEIHGYMTGMIQRAGLDALSGGTMPLLLSNNESVDD